MSTVPVPRNGDPTLKCKSEERSNCPCDDSNGRQETCLFVQFVHIEFVDELQDGNLCEAQTEDIEKFRCVEVLEAN